MELVALYKWTILAGIVAAPLLALVGVQLAARERSMQTLCVGQGATVGVLVGLGFFHHLESSPLGAIGPFFSAIAMSISTFVFTDLMVRNRPASKSTLFAFVFALLSSISYLASSVFPAMESHLAQVFFGDLATLTEFDSKLAIFMSAVCLSVWLLFRKSITNESFELSIFGESVTGVQSWVFKILSVVIIAFSVQFMGFLFTISMLFLPTGILSYMKANGLRAHTILCSLVAIVSVLIGFGLSLKFTRIPTVPAMVLVLSGVSVISAALDWVWSGITKSLVLKQEVTLGEER